MSERTHWQGCWRDPRHHECAVAMVEQLRAALEQIQFGSEEVTIGRQDVIRIARESLQASAPPGVGGEAKS